MSIRSLTLHYIIKVKGGKKSRKNNYRNFNLLTNATWTEKIRDNKNTKEKKDEKYIGNYFILPGKKKKNSMFLRGERLAILKLLLWVCTRTEQRSKYIVGKNQGSYLWRRKWKGKSWPGGWGATCVLRYGMGSGSISKNSWFLFTDW